MAANEFDLIVIGGGILGTFCAYHALEKGKHVALIERTQLPREATVRNFGQIVPSGLSSTWRKYGLKSLEIYKQLQTIADFTVRENGSVYVASNADELTLLNELHQSDKDLGYHSTLLNPAETCDLLPGLKSNYCIGALRYAHEASVDPRQMIHRVLQYCLEQKRLAYHPYTIAVGVDTHGERCTVSTNTGKKISGRKVILCPGAEYQLLFPELFHNDEISCVKIHMLMTEVQPTQRIPGNVLSGLSIRRYEAFHECPSYAQIKAKNDQDPRVEQWGIHILFKQTDSGEVIIGDAHHYADAHDKEHLGFDLEQEVNDYILERAQEIFDLQTWRIGRSWSGIYPQTKHTDVLSRQIDANIYVVNAIGGKGMTCSPGYTYFFIEQLYDND